MAHGKGGPEGPPFSWGVYKRPLRPRGAPPNEAAKPWRSHVRSAHHRRQGIRCGSPRARRRGRGQAEGPAPGAAWPGGGAGGRGPGQPDLRQVEGRADQGRRHALRGAPPAGRRHPGPDRGPRETAQRRQEHPRHPGAAAPAERPGPRPGDRRDRPGQGRRRPDHHQRRPPGVGPAGPGALHPRRLPDADPGSAGRPAEGQERRGGRPLQPDGQAHGPAAAAGRLHRHHRPLAHPGPAGRVPPGRHPGGRRRPAGDGQGRLDQAGRDRDRRRHQPSGSDRRGRQGQDRRRRGL